MKAVAAGIVQSYTFTIIVAAKLTDRFIRLIVTGLIVFIKLLYKFFR